MKTNLTDLLPIKSKRTETIEILMRERIQEVIKDIFEEELTDFLRQVKAKKLPDGRDAVTRNGYHSPRTIQTTAGNFTVKIPRTRDRSGNGENFHSCIIPAYKRRTATLDEAICYFYLKGISTNQMVGVWQEIFGKDVKNLSPAVVSKLRQKW